MRIKLRTLYLIVFGVIFCALVILMLSAFSNVKASSSEVYIKPKVIIDAGHGGEDGGAEAGGVVEKDINLSISLILADMLRAQGFEVEEVRREDISVYSDEAETLSQKKTSDLHNRSDLFNCDPNNVVISIHQNKFENPKYFGTQIFYSTNDGNSPVLAESIKTAVTMLLQPDNARECKPASSEIFILDQAKVPAVIVECGFLSNEQERQKLMTEEYQKKLAFSIMLGFLDYNQKIN